MPPRGTKGRDCGPSPLETPPGVGRGSGSGKRSRGCPLCDPTNAMPANAGTHSGHLGTFSAAGRRLLIFVGSSYRPLLRMGELTQMCQLIPDIFSFPPCTAHFLFDVSKRKWGVRPCGGSPRPFAEQRECKKHSNGQSPFGSSIPHGITMLPRAATPHSFVKQGTYRGHLHGKAVLLRDLSGKNTTFCGRNIRNVYYAEKEAAGRIPASS